MLTARGVEVALEAGEGGGGRQLAPPNKVHPAPLTASVIGSQHMLLSTGSSTPPSSGLLKPAALTLLEGDEQPRGAHQQLQGVRKATFKDDVLGHTDSGKPSPSHRASSTVSCRTAQRSSRARRICRPREDETCSAAQRECRSARGLSSLLVAVKVKMHDHSRTNTAHGTTTPRRATTSTTTAAMISREAACSASCGRRSPGRRRCPGAGLSSCRTTPGTW